jgi:predicted nucleic acid-binding protein
MGSLTLQTAGVVALDTQILIYAVETQATYSPLLRPLWQSAADGRVQLVASELVRLEVMVRPLRDGRVELQNQYRQLLDGTRLTLRAITPAVLVEAARLRAVCHSLRTPDAIHAASALLAGADVFLSNDQGFRQVADLPLALLSELAA